MKLKAYNHLYLFIIYLFTNSPSDLYISLFFQQIKIKVQCNYKPFQTNCQPIVKIKLDL